MSEWEPVRVQMRSGGDFVELDDGASVWSKLTITRTAEGDEPEVRADVEVSPDGLPTCREVHITTMGAGRPVRARDLRAVQLDGLLDAGYAMATLRSVPHPRVGDDTGEEWLTTATAKESRSAFAAARKRRKRVLDDALLSEVAQVYRANVDRSPTKAVGERFGKQPSTAALYVRLAREAGFLGAARKGKAGER